MLHITDAERAAEHGLRYDLLLRLYDEMESAFDVSLFWPPNGYEMVEKGELIEIEAEFGGVAAIGYDARMFHGSHADDEEYVRGCVEGCLERIEDEEPEAVGFLRNLWEGGNEEDRGYVLEMSKEECHVREGRFGDRPGCPV